MTIQVNQLSLQIGSRLLLKALNWQVQPGECWCIIGRNGAGKTTLLRSLAGLQQISAGQIFFNQRLLARWPLMELARLRSYLPQGRNDAFAYRVIETVLGARHPYHDGNYWESEQDVQLALEALRELDVADLAQRDVRSLSGGERQRVAIAALLAQDAQCMLLDEPSNALDLSHQHSVMQIISQQCRTHHKAVIMVSHDLNLAFRYASHALLLMHDGSWQAGPVRQIMTEAALSQCLEYPIETIWHGEMCLFVPR
ncbi:iron complex transport system ATP-binding protein [Oxalobacteraceae bacterium GrIS 2.11]